MVEIFLQTYFPPLPEYEAPKKLDAHKYHQLPMHKVTEKEVQEVIFRVRSFKATRINKVLVVMWQKIWLVIKEVLIALFQALLNQGKLPDK